MSIVPSFDGNMTSLPPVCHAFPLIHRAFPWAQLAFLHSMSIVPSPLPIVPSVKSIMPSPDSLVPSLWCTVLGFLFIVPFSFLETGLGGYSSTLIEM
jgi:hypothetical protein